MPPARTLRIALAGNPNSGKTSLFNLLSGLHQQVGNWPGVTVERKLGRLEHAGYAIEIIDLPGIYSLTAHSLEEQIARDYILTTRPDVVVNVVDAANLVRHLYLSVQFIEMGLDVVLALNMWDEFERSGSRLDCARMELLLGVPVVPTVGHRGRGRAELLDAIVQLAETRHAHHRHVPVTLGRPLEEAVLELVPQLTAGLPETLDLPPRYLAVKLLEGDAAIAAELYNRAPALRPLLTRLEERRARLRASGGVDPARQVSDARRGFIAGLLHEVQSVAPADRMAPSRRIDRVLTHRWLGLPIFVAGMWLLFNLTFTLGAPAQAALAWVIAQLAHGLAIVLPVGWVRSLIVEGILSGVGAVLVFIPNILLLFLGVALLEESGYMARAAFIMDRLMHVLGLHGKSFIPMLMGFGCSVPAILATRTLENRRDRILTALLVPHMSCSARLPLYVLLAGAFFGRQAGNVIALIYLLGIVVAVLVGRLLSATLFRHEQSAFVMELPPYRRPTLRGLIVHTRSRVWHYLRKMGGVVLIAACALWFCSVFPSHPARAQYAARLAALERAGAPAAAIDGLEAQQAKAAIEYSIAGRLGKAIAPVLAPLGFPGPLGVTLVGGFVAKEVVVSSMAVLYQADPNGTTKARAALSAALRAPGSGLTPLVAFAFMAFVLLYTPCIATVMLIRREFGARWMWFDIGYQLGLAWVVAFVIYQGGRILGLG